MSPVRDSIGFFAVRAACFRPALTICAARSCVGKEAVGTGPRKGEKARAGNKPGSVVDNHSSGTTVTDRL